MSDKSKALKQRLVSVWLSLCWLKKNSRSISSHTVYFSLSQCLSCSFSFGWSISTFQKINAPYISRPSFVSPHLSHGFSTVSSALCEMLPLFHLSGLMCTCYSYGNVFLQADCYLAQQMPRICHKSKKTWCVGVSWAWNWKLNHHALSDIRPNFQNGRSFTTNVRKRRFLQSFHSKYTLCFSTILTVFSPLVPLTSVRRLLIQRNTEPNCSTWCLQTVRQGFQMPCRFLILLQSRTGTFTSCALDSCLQLLYSQKLYWKWRYNGDVSRQWKGALLFNSFLCIILQCFKVLRTSALE